ncbi:uncharacterized protein G2W53_039590 [Senna tora]|uniref:Reverse transcriptase zinc-binding domain-containing protein n=1 Tax=Senna tora TaxID=362788 RepID=A0A834SNV4_9FABA|nr:uncharacterized protein G2W53_039590 [Senna tora]
MEKSISRRIGDGQSTLVFKDNWIPNYPAREVLSSSIRVCPNLLVFTLISSPGVWNREALSVFFPLNVANNILSIPLAREPKDDIWFWALTLNAVWKRIWKLQLPAKFKFFLWRMCREILPVCSNLVKRGVDLETCCPLCKDEEETVSHAILNCVQLRELWSSLPVPFVGESDADMSFIEWFNVAITQWDDDSLCIFAIAAYKMWNKRNEVRLGCTSPPSAVLNESILGLWSELSNLQDRADPPSASQAPSCSWLPLDFNCCKVNVDACKSSAVATGVGVVIRNFQGRVLGALARRATPCASVELLEATTILAGMEFARDLRCPSVVVEGDAQFEFKLLNGQSSSLSWLSTVVDSILSLRYEFSSICFRWFHVALIW